MGRIVNRPDVPVESTMVDCPDCENGFVQEEGQVVKCDVCYGRGRLTEHEYEQWERDVVDVHEAERRYIRSLAD